MALLSVICAHVDWTSGLERWCVAEQGHVDGEHWYQEVVVLGEDES